MGDVEFRKARGEEVVANMTVGARRHAVRVLAAATPLGAGDLDRLSEGTAKVRRPRLPTPPVPLPSQVSRFRHVRFTSS